MSNVVCITISLDRQTLETLDKVTINRSAYIRQLLHDKWGSFQVHRVKAPEVISARSKSEEPRDQDPSMPSMEQMVKAMIS